MAKIYTKKGDEGKTSLYSGERVSKSSLRVDLGGTIDELQAFLGLARATTRHTESAATLYHLECKLMHAMTELAVSAGEAYIFAEDVVALEQAIDTYSTELQGKFSFAVPGESPGSATLHVARTVARRCERRLVSLVEEEDGAGAGAVSPTLLAFFNRISDLCYTLALYEDQAPCSSASS